MRFRRRFECLCERVGEPAFEVAYWDGTRRRFGEGEPAFRFHIRRESALRSLFTNPHLRFGDAFVQGEFEVEGDLRQLVRAVYRLDGVHIQASIPEKLYLTWEAFRLRNRTGQAQRNVAAHYDLGNDFFKLWLGETMAYSCAYFHNPQDTLDTAQRQKFAHICKKLILQPGQRLLDIGCGWGGLVIYAAQTYGVEALGLTLSEEQAQWARRAVRERGLQDRVTIEMMDYRELPRSESFDRVVSVGMFEHVGREFIGAYMGACRELLHDDGLGIVHTIGKTRVTRTNPWITTTIFPGMYLPSLGELADGLGEAGLQVIDVENLRVHYAMTVDHWIERFEAHIDEVTRMYDANFARMWRLYLNISSASFRWGELCVWQISFSVGVNNALSLTRQHLYTEQSRDIALAEV